MSGDTYDVVAVGGGPGGSTVASLVAAQGRRVALFEREKFPRYQIGESLLPATVHGICRLLGVADEVAAAGFVRKNGAAFRWGTSPEPWIFGFSQAQLLQAAGADFAYQVERAKFDTILLENARRLGVEVYEEHEVNRLVVRDGRVCGVEVTDGEGRHRRVDARFVVDASGHGSPVHRHVGRRVHSKFFRNLALFCYFRGAGRLPAPNQGNILCEAFPGGWIWFIPLSQDDPTLTSVGAVVDPDNAPLIQQAPERAMSEFVGKCPKISTLLSGASRVTDDDLYGRFRVRRDWSYTNERFWAPGIALVGDAACFIDPVLSTGVHLSTYSALLAARSINSCLSGFLDETVAFREFESRYRDEYATCYNFLIAFYDMHRDEESYYWEARKVLQTEESANEAFVRLVAGGVTAPEVYIRGKGGIGETLQGFARRLEIGEDVERGPVTAEMAASLHRFELDGGTLKHAHGGGEDLRRVTWGRDLPWSQDEYEDAGGLVPSEDGVHWLQPAGRNAT